MPAERPSSSLPTVSAASSGSSVAWCVPVLMSRNACCSALPLDASDDDTVDAFEGGAGGWVTGSVAEVRDKLVAQWQDLPCEYIVVTWHYAQQPKESVIDQLEIFMKEIKPALDELTPYENGA